MVLVAAWRETGGTPGRRPARWLARQPTSCCRRRTSCMRTCTSEAPSSPLANSAAALRHEERGSCTRDAAGARVWRKVASSVRGPKRTCRNRGRVSEGGPRSGPLPGPFSQCFLFLFNVSLECCCPPVNQSACAPVALTYMLACIFHTKVISILPLQAYVNTCATGLQQVLWSSRHSGALSLDNVRTLAGVCSAESSTRGRASCKSGRSTVSWTASSRPASRSATHG